MRKIVLFFLSSLLIVIFTSENIFACKYSWKINSCKSALKSFIWKDFENMTVWWRLRNFSDFPCIQAWDEAIAFQIATDENFSKIDKDMDNFLKELYKSKNFYFSWWQSYFEWVQQIFLQRDEFKKRYDKACVQSFSETLECVNDGENKALSVLWSLNFIWWAQKSGSCFLLWKTKTDIFLDIAYNWLLLNSTQVWRDKHKEYVQKERDAYSDLMRTMKVNQSYIERLNSKWTSKTKHTYNW